jgi:hypothetical protein
VVTDIGGPSPPRTYVLPFKPHADSFTGKDVPLRFFSLIDRDYRELAFPTILVFSLIDQSDSPDTRQTLAFERAEWTVNQLVIAGVPRQNIKARVLSRNELFTYSGIGNPYGVTKPDDVGIGLTTLRLVIIQGYSPYR